MAAGDGQGDTDAGEHVRGQASGCQVTRQMPGSATVSLAVWVSAAHSSSVGFVVDHPMRRAVPRAFRADRQRQPAHVIELVVSGQTGQVEDEAGPVRAGDREQVGRAEAGATAASTR